MLAVIFCVLKHLFPSVALEIPLQIGSMFYSRKQMYELSLHLFVFGTDLKFDDICWGSCTPAEQFHIWAVYFFCLSDLSLPIVAGSPLLSPQRSSMLDILVHGLYLVSGGAEVSGLPLQSLHLSCALLQLKWTCSESTLKNYFSLSRR